MNTPENKHLLWELTKDLYSPGLERDHVIELFESTVAEVDEASSASLLEKNKTFLTVYIEKIVRETRKPQEAILHQLAELRLEVRELKALLKKE
jgi:hypothetical protein